jgi:alpha-1,2-mannosyltransferase
MARFFDLLRTGSWLSGERLRLWLAAALTCSLAGLAYVIATAHGLNDFQGRPLGTDFSGFYAAGTYVLEGRPQAPFNGAAQHAREQAIFGADTAFYAFIYPPFFLFIVAALAALPYLLALLVWQGATLALYLWMVKAVVTLPPTAAPRPWFLPALASPAVFVNLIHGQNGLLTASLLGGALALLARRPLLAGMLFGLLAYKPQFGLMIPLALIAGAQWRAFAAAATTVVLLVAATLIAFGPDPWQAFLASSTFARVVILEMGEGGLPRIQSVFAWTRMWGGPIPLAYAVQGAVTIAVAAVLIRMWRSDDRYAIKAAGLTIGTLLATPYSLDYDLIALTPAIAFLACNGLRCGFAPYEKTALAFLWFVPFVARSVAQTTAVPLGVIAMLVTFTLLLRRNGPSTYEWN